MPLSLDLLLCFDFVPRSNRLGTRERARSTRSVCPMRQLSVIILGSTLLIILGLSFSCDAKTVPAVAAAEFWYLDNRFTSLRLPCFAGYLVMLLTQTAIHSLAPPHTARCPRSVAERSTTKYPGWRSSMNSCVCGMEDTKPAKSTGIIPAVRAGRYHVKERTRPGSLAWDGSASLLFCVGTRCPYADCCYVTYAKSDFVGKYYPGADRLEWNGLTGAT